MIKTIAQIVLLIEFKFTLGKVASNVANSSEVLMIKFGVCVCVLVKPVAAHSKRVFNMSSKVGGVGLEDNHANCSTCLSLLIGSLMTIV